MANLGEWPIDESTPVGAFRIEIGDSVPVGTPTTGPQGADFEFFSDAYLTGLLERYPDDPEFAMASTLDTMARRLIILAEDIQVDDIKIKTVERAKIFSEHANSIRAFGITRGGEGFQVSAIHTTQSDGWGHVQGIADHYHSRSEVG